MAGLSHELRALVPLSSSAYDAANQRRMKILKITSVLALLALSSGSNLSAQNPPTQSPPVPQNVTNQDFELNTILMQSTFMLQGKNAQGQDTIGTGFVMGRPLP